LSTGNLQTLALNLQSKIDYAKDLQISQESIDFTLGGDNETFDFDNL